MDKSLGLSAGRSGVRILGRGKWSLRTTAVDARVKYPLFKSENLLNFLPLLILVNFLPQFLFYYDLKFLFCWKTIRRRAIRETGISRYHGDLIEGIPDTPRTSLQYGIKGFKGDPIQGLLQSSPSVPYPIYAERCVQHLLSERLRLSA